MIFLPATGRGTAVGGGGAQAAMRKVSCKGMYPSTMLRMVPLPGPGRN
jgi:hypothetical protein